ncbi:MAG: PASTA domain-containing protein [Oscillospiraceae bacterium]|nr:PASTA domain-containing protein [Oscillospiraceae bacterium]
MLVCGVGLFIPLVIQLWTISIRDHDFYQQRATDQQLMDVSVSAHRGDILDANGDVLAMSATVYNLILAPKDLMNSVDRSDYTDEEGNEDEEAWSAAVQELRDEIIDGLMAIRPDLDRADLERRMAKENSQYEVLLTELEEEEAQAIRTFIEENNTGYYLYLTPSTKRYYPFGALASQVLGFVNSEGGVYGLEAGYESILKGVPGRVVTGRTAQNDELYNSYSNYVDAVNGYNLTLTIDSTIQSYAEQILEKGIAAYDVRNGGVCIVANPKTMEILAMASSPEFDPNNYSAIMDSLLQGEASSNVQGIYEQLKAENDQKPAEEQLTDAELQQQAQSQANAAVRETQWLNKGLREPYEPGSTFKALVLAAALEEGVVSESDTFYCPGYYEVNGVRIYCSERTGKHGNQTLAEAVQNSCNPAFMMIGQRLGAEKFYDYFEAFGMKEKTGIDLPGELTGLVWDRDYITSLEGYLSLATASFGQRFTVTPIQMITAFSAVINGGNLYQPYVVQSISDASGAVIQNTEPTLIRQVVSEETSRRCRAILETVVSEGTGGNAYQAGYRIGGKTGSSETIPKEDDRTIVSFMGFAPADDPEIIVLLAYDKPQPASPGSNWSTTGVYISGGNMAAPMAGEVIAQILDYLDVEKQYTAEESAAVDVTTPQVTGYTVADAETRLSNKGLSYRTIGEGDVVTSQVPAANSAVPGGSTVILYLGGATPEETGTVPNVVGQSYEAAKNALEAAGFFMRATGTSTFYTNSSRVQSQSVAGGETAAIGTVIDVQFSTVVEDSYAGLD